jgi:hypothetical protein
VRCVCAILVVVGSGMAQPKDPCYAFLLKGDVTVVCEGKTARVTRRGDIHNFAVSNELATLAYITGSEGVATLVDLKTRASRKVQGADEVVSSCGGILPIPVGAGDATRELVSGAELSFPPFRRFRCSADRRSVVGISRRELYLGERKLAGPGDVHDLYFNISADGSKVAYFNDIKPLCVAAASATEPRCVQHETMADPVSVNDAGETLTAAGTGKGCDYKNSFDFSPAKNPTAGDDECLGVGYWKPGMESIVFLQPVGRNPQWLKAETAKLLMELGK